jgi:hypothetical protein
LSGPYSSTTYSIVPSDFHQEADERLGEISLLPCLRVQFLDVCAASATNCCLHVMLSLGKNLKESLMILFCPGIKHFSYA